MKKYLPILSLSAVLTLSGCVDAYNSLPSEQVYNANQIGQAQTTYFATLLSVKPVIIQGDTSPLVDVAATALGALAGAQIGGGSGKVAGAIVGGLAAGYGADTATGQLNKTQGVQLTVKLDSGRVLTFVQKGNPNNFKVGQRVQLIESYDGTFKVDN